MKRSFSLKTQFFGLMALVVVLQSLALVCMLIVSRIFLMLDAEAFRLFENTANTRAQTYNAEIGQLVGSMAVETERLSDKLGQVADSHGVAAHELYEDSDAYLDAALAGTDSLFSLLRSNHVTGAFVLLDGSGASETDDKAHAGVYLRNSAPGSVLHDTGNYLMEVGPIAVAQQHTIPVAVNWELDIKETEAGLPYYDKPIQAALDEPRAEMERYGYWSTPIDILGDNQQVVCYTMPLLDGDGAPYGVVGVEISLVLFGQYYLPNTDLPYQNSFYSIANVHDNTVQLDWYIPSGPLAQVYLQQAQSLSLTPEPAVDEYIYKTRVEGLGDMYCTVLPLTMYSRNSPFYEESWSLLSFVPQNVLHETSSSVRAKLNTSIIITTAATFVAVFLIIYATTRRISGLSQYVQSLKPHQEIKFTRTGIREIDELTSAVEQLNRSVINASKTTSKILELTRMPLGGFEAFDETGFVFLTEYIYVLLGIPEGTEINREIWEKEHARLVASPAEEYENIYQYIDKAGEEKWLRIIETETETGRVGIVLDVTRDIEEHRRLAHELDYDALTHLYSRVAFKREVFRLINDAPQRIGAMMFIDLDNLKYTNDTYGHDMGDRLIIRAAEIFRQFMFYGGVVSRISGDEFAVYLHGYDSQAEVKKIIMDVFRANADFTLQTPDGVNQRVRFSTGIAYYPVDSTDVTDLLKLSDYAMYEAKHNQKGSVFEFNKASYMENAYLLENREAINLLLDEKLIRFAFQPIVELRTGEVIAYEALMRPLLDTFKSPLEILAVAESQSQLGRLEWLVVTMAHQAIKENAETLGNRRMFINSIPSQVLSDEENAMLVEEYSDIFDRIVAEIIEEENNEPERLKRKLDFFRANGISVAVDDFGSGYSNEIRILALNPEIIKIDIALISHIDTDPDKQKLVANLVSFCQPKGVKLVAEGVERREELAEVIRLGVDYVQGYYLARPAFELADIPEKAKKEILYLHSMVKRDGE